MKKTTSGFTIVELLLVIVVIAILATIASVGYNNTQQRAKNAQVVSGVETYKKVIINYAVRNNGYPNNFGACLGASYPSNRCWNGPNGTYDVSAGFDTLMTPYLGSTKPVLGTSYMQVTSTDQRVGAIYLYYSPTNVRIAYYLSGANQDCLDGDTATTEMQTTQCIMQLPEV